MLSWAGVPLSYAGVSCFSHGFSADVTCLSAAEGRFGDVES